MYVAMLDDEGRVIRSIDTGGRRATEAIWEAVKRAVDGKADPRGIQIGHGNVQNNRF